MASLSCVDTATSYPPVGTLLAAAGAAAVPSVGSFNMRTKASWLLDIICNRAGLVCPICCNTEFNNSGFCWTTERICWNVGWLRKKAKGSFDAGALPWLLPVELLVSKDKKIVKYIQYH